MINLTLQEAQLLRILQNFFGSERVVFGMSVASLLEIQPENKEWLSEARKTLCQFTILDHQDIAKLVICFNFDLDGNIDVIKLENHERLAFLLDEIKVPYVTINSKQFNDMIRSGDNSGIFNLLAPYFLE